MKEILRETGNVALNSNPEIIEAILQRVIMQQADLLRALGLDASRPDYAEAFIELAKIHHGMGVLLVGKARGSNSRAAKWSREQDAVLKGSVAARLRRGMTTAAALRAIANDKLLYLQFPVVENSRSEKPTAIRREQNYRKRLAFILKRDAAENEQNKIIEGRAKIAGHQPTVRKRNLTNNLGKSKSSKS